MRRGSVNSVNSVNANRAGRQRDRDRARTRTGRRPARALLAGALLLLALGTRRDWAPLGPMRVTAYCPCAKCCGKWADGHFADGSRVDGQALRAVAAPRSIPLGTILWIQGVGAVVVRDRGGAIKGGKLDLFHATHQAALNWGRTTRRVWQRRRTDDLPGPRGCGAHAPSMGGCPAAQRCRIPTPPNLRKEAL